MTGSLAIGWHEGSRSEYLAQFVFIFVWHGDPGPTSGRHRN
jgi:hypothetical protein